ncbi:amidase [Paeniglutamicibacter sp. NPDC012692]|uniref:amidase n=1 Tax=Paeniglutamicibacter sp. NPDC012692 TaxID=3364388 RepID=UPI00368BB356
MMDGIQNMGAREMTESIQRRELSAREALQSHIDQIQRVNDSINAVVTTDFERAESLAAAADEATARGTATGALHGLPMTHKDTYNTAGLRSTQGSLTLRNHVPDTDDLLIGRLSAAGVIRTGKTNVPEFGAGSHTFNEVFGTTTNPYDTALSAGGSSGGVAAAIASHIQPLGDGSDMGGSLRIPAAFCNVAGFRPSYGVIPMPAATNSWAWLARGGPMARSVDDIALFMSATAGDSPRVATPNTLAGQDFENLPENALRGIRIGYSRDFGLGVPVEPEILAVLDAQIAHFEDAGAHVEEASIDLRDADLVFDNTRAYDFATGLGELVRTQRELIKPEVIWNVEKGWALSAQDLIDTTAARTRLEVATQAFFARYDLFLSPATQVLPFDASWRYPEQIAGVPATTYLDWMRSACLLSATSLPVLSMPAGFTGSGLPVGLQMAANHYQDASLLAFARDFEQRTRYAEQAPSLVTATQSPQEIR